MGGADWQRIGLGVATGGMSEMERAGIGPSAASGKGSSSKGGAPDAPDFNAAAQIQADSSRDIAREQTQANRPNQSNPFGFSEWAQGPDGSWTQRSGLAGPLQGAADGLMGQVASGAGLDPAAERDRAIAAAYGQSTSRLDPRFSSARSARETQLANEGFSRGDAGWGNAMDEFGRQENDAYQQAMYGAQTGAGNIAFDQAMASRMQPYQQLGALQSLGGQPGFTSAQGAQPLQSLAAAMQGYGADLDAYNAQQAGKNSKMAGGATLGAAALGASDERLKTEIERLPVEAVPGVPFARWKWKDTGEAGFGVIAQDLEKVRPDLVTELGGVKHVRYGGLR